MRKEQAFQRRHAPAAFSSVVVAKHKTQSAGDRKAPDSDSDTETDSDDNDGCVNNAPPPPPLHVCVDAHSCRAVLVRLVTSSPSPPQAPARHVALPTPGAAGSQPVFYQQASAPPPPVPGKAPARGVPAGAGVGAGAPVVPPPERPVHDETTRALFAHMWQSMKEVCVSPPPGPAASAVGSLGARARVRDSTSLAVWWRAQRQLRVWCVARAWLAGAGGAPAQARLPATYDGRQRGRTQAVSGFCAVVLCACAGVLLHAGCVALLIAGTSTPRRRARTYVAR